MAAFSTLAAIGIAGGIGAIAGRMRRKKSPTEEPPVTAPAPTTPLGAPPSVSESGSAAAVAGLQSATRQRKRAAAGMPLGKRPTSAGLLLAPLQPKGLIGA